MNVVFDTDVLYSGLRSSLGASRVWLMAALTGRVTPVATTALWLEYEAVLTRPGALSEFGLTSGEVGELLDGLADTAKMAVRTYRMRPVARDPDDDMVVEAALAGEAELLLTFNVRDFASARGLGFEILSPGGALERHRAFLEGS